MPRCVVGVSCSCQLSGWLQEHSEGVTGTLVLAHPVTESIEIVSSNAAINFRSRFGSSFIGLVLLFSNLLASLLLGALAKPRGYG